MGDHLQLTHAVGAEVSRRTAWSTPQQKGYWRATPLVAQEEMLFLIRFSFLNSGVNRQKIYLVQ